jgi:hypothetical protein
MLLALPIQIILKQYMTTCLKSLLNDLLQVTLPLIDMTAVCMLERTSKYYRKE